MLRSLGLRSGASWAKAPFIGHGAPVYYRFKLGDSEATIISDGVLPLGPPQGAFIGLSDAEINKQLTDNFLPTNNVPLEQNVLVLNTGDRIMIFDTGMGSAKLFGDSTGKMLEHLKRAGIDPASVDALVISHGHIDHCGGIMTPAGVSNFPNAQIYITQADYDFWTDPDKVGPKLKAFLDQTQQNLVPNRERIRFIKDGEEVLPGVHAILAPGHTVGHTIFMITSGNQSMCYIADLTHHPVLLLQKPRTQFAYDTDPVQSAESRVKMLDMLAANRTMILAYHFAWPGLGHVAKDGDGFRYFPAPMDSSG